MENFFSFLIVNLIDVRWIVREIVVLRDLEIVYLKFGSGRVEIKNLKYSLITIGLGIGEAEIYINTSFFVSPYKFETKPGALNLWHPHTLEKSKN